MTTTYTSYKLISADLSTSLKRVSEQPDVKRETEYYLSKIGSIKTIDEFFADSRLYNYAMKAHGLEDMAYAKAFMRKVLTEGVDNKDAFANQLSDTRYKALAAGYPSRKGGPRPKRGLYAFQSADGIRWSLMSEEPVITLGAFDSQNLAFWDSERKCYYAYHRHFTKGVRDIMWSTSKDFLK